MDNDPWGAVLVWWRWHGAEAKPQSAAERAAPNNRQDYPATATEETVNIGPLDVRARVEYKVVTADPDYGTELITWTLLRVMWVGIQDELPSKSEAVKQGLAVATRRARVRANYATDIDSSMRLVIMRPTSTVYQIVAGPAVIGDKEGIEMWVEAISS